MKFTDACCKPQLTALAIVKGLMSACATVSSKSVIWVCPPVVEYDTEFQALAVDELQLLPVSSIVVEMLNDYTVIREQARGCQP